MVFLNRIETSVPEFDVHSKFVSFVPSLCDSRVAKVFERLAAKSGIEHRYSVIEPSEVADELDVAGFYKRGSFATTAARMKRYREEAFRLVEAPVARALDRIDRNEITHLIVTSCTGFTAPGLDLEIQKRFELRSDLERTVIGFMGCYAAMNALKSAWHIVRSQPRARVLLVNVELCTLHMQESADPEQLLAFLQFADGCAVSLVSADPFGLRIDGFHADVMPAAEDLIRWDIGDRGFEMVLSPEVPKAIGLALPDVKPRLPLEGVRLWAIHPGGRSILDVVADKLGLSEHDMSFSRSVLRDFGNMSSATVLFVLQRMMAAHEPIGPGLAMAFGPGLTIETMKFEKQAR